MIDRHHILFDQRSWNASELGRSLRGTPALIPRVDREVHNEIHREVPFVPVLGYHALMAVRNNFEPSFDPLQSMDNLMFAIEDAGKHPRAHRIETEMCRLAIEAIELQRPYIAYGAEMKLAE